MSNETIEGVEKRITKAKQELAELEYQLKTYEDHTGFIPEYGGHEN